MRLDAEYRDFVLERERERREAELRQQGAVLADVMKSVFEKALGNVQPQAVPVVASSPAASASVSTVEAAVALPFPPLPPVPQATASAAAAAPPVTIQRVPLLPDDEDEVTPAQLRLLAAELQNKVPLMGITSRKAAEEVILQKCIENREVVRLIGDVYTRYGARTIPRATCNRVRGLFTLVR